MACTKKLYPLLMADGVIPNLAKLAVLCDDASASMRYLTSTSDDYVDTTKLTADAQKIYTQTITLSDTNTAANDVFYVDNNGGDVIHLHVDDDANFINQQVDSAIGLAGKYIKISYSLIIITLIAFIF
jgi:hypothetical protein